MPLKLRLLGVPLLHRTAGDAGREVHLQAKRLALLAFLAVRRPPGWCRREALMALLWPEGEEGDARNALSQAIHQLRAALGGSVVETRGNDEVRVSTGRLWCDTAAFDEALADDRCEDALDVYRGPFLDGLRVAGAPPFDDWLSVERERWRARAAGAAEVLARRERDRGRTTGCLRWLQRLLELSPDDESALRQLMAVKRAAGDLGGALRDYREFERRLSLELDVAPDGETRLLADRIRSERTRGARDPRADEACWRGLLHWSRRTPEDMRKAASCFQQAMERNPSSGEAMTAFAMAGTGLAAAFYDAEPATRGYPSVKSALARALAIDPGNAEAMAILAFVQGLYERNWAEAEATAARACALAPDNPTVHHARAVLAAYVGKTADAIASIEQAARLEPLVLGYREIRGIYLYTARRHREAAEDLKGLLQLEPRLYLARMGLGLAMAALGETAAAEQAYRAVLEVTGRHPYPLASLAVLLAGTRPDEAERLLDELVGLSSSRYVRPTYLATVHAALGDLDRAFAALERAVEECDIHATSIVADPALDSVRTDRRFPHIVRRLGLELVAPCTGPTGRAPLFGDASRRTRDVRAGEVAGP